MIVISEIQHAAYFLLTQALLCVDAFIVIMIQTVSRVLVNAVTEILISHRSVSKECKNQNQMRIVNAQLIVNHQFAQMENTYVGVNAERLDYHASIQYLHWLLQM